MEKRVDEKQEEKLKEEARKISIREGAASSLMEGFGNRFVTPFALALNATNAQIGFLATLPGLVGNLAQLISLRLIKKMSRKKILLKAVFFQALLWLPLILIGGLYFFFNLSSNLSVILLIAIYTVMIFVGAIAGPAWSSWMRDIVSVKNGEFFAKRGKVVTAFLLGSMLLAGFILDYFQKRTVFYGFAILFFIALIGRMVSYRYFTKKYEPVYVHNEQSHFSLRQFVIKMHTTNFGRFVIFIALITFATSVAGPFFAVYMLENLGLSYLSFTIITISPVLATLLFLPIWGRFSDNHGNIRILQIVGFLISTIPILWVIVSFVPLPSKFHLITLLVGVEIFSGYAWSGFNHAAATFIYEAVSREKMAYCFSYFNIINSIGAFLGAILGGFIASQPFVLFGFVPIIVVFLLSSILRLLSYSIMISKVKEVKPVTTFSVSRHVKNQIDKGAIIFWKVIGFKPITLKQYFTQ
ncbi:MAG: MFS transporter [Nanoarchaeota archaeon]|nr:MFS transporter [Nanoarchaeota archaeon]